MNSTVKQRIKEFIKYSNITVQKFELKCGMSNGYVNSIKNSIGSDKIESIIRVFPNLNQSWLINGEGDMVSKKNTPMIERINELIKYYGISVLAYSKMIGIPQKTLNNQVNGSNEVGTGTLLAILFYDEEISAEWLMRGTGDMLLSKSAKKDIPTPSLDSCNDKEIDLLKEENIKLKEDIIYLKGYNAALIDQFCPKKEDREGKSA